MCQFGDSSNIIEELNLTQDQAIIGYRAWYITNPFNDKEKYLKSLNQNFLWPKKEICLGGPTRDNSLGIYNNYNYYNYNYYNYNYYNYNYNNYNYNICGCSKLFGKVFKYKEGYRSSQAIPHQLVILSDGRWFKDEKIVKFVIHFNETITKLAKEYDCSVIGYDDWLNQGQ